MCRARAACTLGDRSVLGADSEKPVRDAVERTHSERRERIDAAAYLARIQQDGNRGNDWVGVPSRNGAASLPLARANPDRHGAINLCHLRDGFLGQIRKRMGRLSGRPGKEEWFSL